LETLYKRGEKNNSAFNNEKFMLMRYRKIPDVEEETSYFTPEMNSIIAEYDHVRDLGIDMSITADFNFHIETIVKKKTKKVIAWALRYFIYCLLKFSKRLWLTVIRLIIDFGSQVWSSCEGVAMDKI